MGLNKSDSFFTNSLNENIKRLVKAKSFSRVENRSLPLSVLDMATNGFRKMIENTQP